MRRQRVERALEAAQEQPDSPVRRPCAGVVIATRPPGISTRRISETKRLHIDDVLDRLGASTRSNELSGNGSARSGVSATSSMSSFSSRARARARATRRRPRRRSGARAARASAARRRSRDRARRRRPARARARTRRAPSAAGRDPRARAPRARRHSTRRHEAAEATASGGYQAPLARTTAGIVRSDDREVEPHRPALEVEEVEPHELVEVELRAAGDLPQAGHAGQHEVALAVPVLEPLVVALGQRARADERHLAADAR